MEIMAERVGKEKIKRESGWLYYLGKNGYVYRKREGGWLPKNEKIGTENITRDVNYLYFVDKDGYVARTPLKNAEPNMSTSFTMYPSGVRVSTWTPEEGEGRKPHLDSNRKSEKSAASTNKKYTILTNDTKTAPFGNLTLFRIEANKTFGNIKKGDKGGYIQKEENLSTTDKAWVADKAMVFGSGKVSGNAQVYGNALVCGSVSENAKVYDNAQVIGSSQVYGNARIYGNAEIYGDAQVKDNAQVYDDAKVKGNALIFGNARIHGKGWVGFNQKIGSDREITRDIMIDEMR